MVSNYLYLNGIRETPCVDVKNVYVTNVRTAVVAVDNV
tara:strand:+ start:181 stop:294 length:114 start_codon:yes stop_codon:yes gene_type:complete